MTFQPNYIGYSFEEAFDQFQEQIQALKEEYGHTIDNLRYRLENSEIEIDKLRTARVTTFNSSVTSPEHDTTPDRLVDHSRELKVEERQSGEVKFTFYV